MGCITIEAAVWRSASMQLPLGEVGCPTPTFPLLLTTLRNSFAEGFLDYCPGINQIPLKHDHPLVVQAVVSICCAGK